jgi:hypothetical protein
MPYRTAAATRIFAGIEMNADSLRPAEICAQLLQAMGASEGRRKRRKRDTTPDALGMAVKRELLEAAIAADPAADDFEAWLFQQIQRQDAGGLAGATRAMAMAIYDEWQFAVASAGFRDWLAAGAPSDDTGVGSRKSEVGD